MTLGIEILGVLIHHALLNTPNSDSRNNLFGIILITDGRSNSNSKDTFHFKQASFVWLINIGNVSNFPKKAQLV